MNGTSSFFHVPEWARKDLERVRGTLLDTLPPSLKTLLDDRHIVLPAGERDPLRPFLVLLAARAMGCTGERVVRLAAGVQMIHLAALLHDRLGAFPGETVSGDGAARDLHHQESVDILLGDFLFSKASCIIIEDGEERIVRDMIRTSIASAEVQATLVSLEKHPETYLPSRCFDIVAEKLSRLLSLGLRVGATLGNAPDAEQEALSGFGAVFGRVLRIVQDLACWEKPIAGAPAQPGEVRYHHPLLLLWEREGKDAWEEAVRKIRDSAGILPEDLRTRMKADGYLRSSLRQAQQYAEEAVSLLEGQPGLRGTSDLKALVRDVLLRGSGQDHGPHGGSSSRPPAGGNVSVPSRTGFPSL